MIEARIEEALTWIEPGPVTLIATRYGGRNNVMTISWTMAIDFDGHIVFTSGDWNYSFRAIRANRECVVCIPPASMAETVVDIGMVSGEDTDKFRKFALTALPAKTVSAPLVKECLACLECEVEDIVEPYGFVVMKVKRVWVNDEIEDRRILHAVGDGTFYADGERFDFRKRMEAKLPPGI